MICSLKCSAFSTFSRDGTSGKPGVVQFAAAKKQRLVQETYEPGMTVSLVARRHQVSPSLLFRWRKLDAGGALSAMQADEVVVPASQVQALQQQIKELQRLLGKKTMENEILKEAVEYARGKKVTCAQSAGSCPGERCRGNRAAAHDCRGPSDLWIPAALGTAAPGAAEARASAPQRQAGLPGRQSREAAPATLHGHSAGSRPRGQGRRRALGYAQL